MQILPRTSVGVGVHDSTSRVMVAGWAISCVVLVFVAASSAWNPLAWLLIPVYAWLITYTAMLMFAAAIGALTLAAAAVPIVAAGFLLFFTFGSVLPAAFRLVAVGPVSLARVMFGTTLPELALSCELAAVSGLIAGTVVGILNAAALVQRKSGVTLVKALLSRDLWSGELTKVVLGALVGLAVGAVGGASGVVGLCHGLINGLSTSVIHEIPSALQIIVAGGAGGAGAGGQGGVELALLLILIVLIVLLQGLVIGVLSGGAAGTAKGALLGAIKGAGYEAAKRKALAKWTRYGPEPKPALMWDGFTSGASTGALVGAIVGFLHGLVTAGVVAMR